MLKDIELLKLETGLLWPFYKNNKAWSASKLTKFIKDIEFKDIPEYILRIAAERGKAFHETLQEYFRNGAYPSFIDVEVKEMVKFNELEKRIYETINFLKRQKGFLEPSPFIGNEQLHYTLYKGELIASYCDISFEDYIIELKTSNAKGRENPLMMLIFEIQLLIQFLCTNKDIYLLWSTGKGIIFKKFQKTENLLTILDILIDVAREEGGYSINAQKIIAKKILDIHKPSQLFFISEMLSEKK